MSPMESIGSVFINNFSFFFSSSRKVNFAVVPIVFHYG